MSLADDVTALLRSFPPPDATPEQVQAWIDRKRALLAVGARSAR